MLVLCSQNKSFAIHRNENKFALGEEAKSSGNEKGSGAPFSVHWSQLEDLCWPPWGEDQAQLLMLFCHWPLCRACVCAHVCVHTHVLSSLYNEDKAICLCHRNAEASFFCLSEPLGIGQVKDAVETGSYY